MTHLKKSLAMLLTFVMMFSSMSVAASAWKTDSVSDNDIRFTTVFFRLDEETNTWVKTDRAAPGDEVKARVYLETSYPSGTGDMAFIFDSDYFVQNYGTTTGTSLKIESFTTNSSYSGFALRSSGAYWVDETASAANKYNILMDYLPTEGFKIYDGSVITSDFFDTHDLFTNTLQFGSGVTCDYFTLTRDTSGNITDSALANEWVVEYNLKVAESEKTSTVGTKGVGQVPPMYNSPERVTNKDESGNYITADNKMFVDMQRGDLGAETYTAESMRFWDADLTSVEAYLTTTSKITFDLNGGNIAGDTSAVETLGIINTPAKITEPVRDGYIFAGWIEDNACDECDTLIDTKASALEFVCKECEAAAGESGSARYSVADFNSGVYRDSATGKNRSEDVV